MSSQSPSAGFIARVPVRANRNGVGEQYYPVFNIMKSHIEDQTGKRLVFGGFYHINGTIEDAFDFDIHRVIRNYLRVVTPLEHRDKVEFGKVYNFGIRSIEEVQLNEKQREIVANSIGVQYRPLMYRLKHAQGAPVSQRSDHVLQHPLPRTTKGPSPRSWKALTPPSTS